MILTYNFFLNNHNSSVTQINNQILFRLLLYNHAIILK